MSTKNRNFFFKFYLEGRQLFKAIILLETQLHEEKLRDSKLETLRQEMHLALEQLAKLLESQNNITAENVSSTAGDTIAGSNISTDNIVEVNKSDDLSSTGDMTELPTAEQIIANELAAEKLVNEEYKTTVRRLRSLDTKNLLLEYRELFADFKPANKAQNIFDEYSVLEDFADVIFLENVKPLMNENNLKQMSISIVDLHKAFNILFLEKAQNTNLSVFKKFTKLKRNKWRFKKRKLRKLRMLRKIKRAVIFKKFKKKAHSFHFNTNGFVTQYLTGGSRLLVKRIPLSERVIIATNLEFFYKLNRKLREEMTNLSKNYYEVSSDIQPDFIIYLRNYHQKPYWKLRKSRIAHWKLFCNKTIRQQRYKGFLNKFMRNYHKLSYVYTFFVNFFTRFNISWTRTDKLEAFCKNILVENHQNMIIKVPLFFTYFLRWHLLKKRDYRLRKRVGKWSYLNFKRATRPWLQRKKNSPKIANHIKPKAQYLAKISQFDSMTGYVHINTPLITHMLPAVNEFKVNFLIRLHMYRYKSNNKCT